MFNAVIGIDPGAHGAVAFIDRARVNMEVLRFSHGEPYVIRRVEELSKIYSISAMVEHVHGILGDSMQSVFSFGGAMKTAKLCCEFGEIPMNLIDTKDWQKEFSLLKKAKNAHKAKAQEYFGQFKIIHDNADALLIAQFHWEQLFGYAGKI